MSNYEIKGVEALQKKLKHHASMTDVKRVVKVNGEELHNKVHRKVPVDTGTLKRSIMLSQHDGGLTARVKPLVDYGLYPEYGTRYMDAQPYIRPSLQMQKLQFMKDLTRLFR